MPSALSGITVVDFGQYIAGPVAGMLLADQGAEVIRVEPPGGPRLPTPANAVWNRGKRSIVLDLHDERDRTVAAGLIATADVVIENFRPGVMDRLGLGPAAITEANPQLIYCSMPGFASDDPRAAIPGWEGVVEAAIAGFGWSRPTDPDAGDSDAHPVFSALPVPSMYAAFLTAVSIAMALQARDRDGAGQVVEVPLFDATFTALGYRAQRVHEPRNRGGLPDDMAAAMGARRGMVPIAGIRRCKDGRWVYVHSGNKNIVDLVRAVGADTWGTDDDTSQRVEELFLTRTAREWEDLGAQLGTEVVEFRSSAEWLHEVHARESGMVVEVDDPMHGVMLQPGLQCALSATPGSIRGPAPDLDADRVAVLRRVGESSHPPEPRRPPASAGADARPVLDGVKVLDLCIVLAGPTCGRTLAEFGANVIKIEGPPRRRAAMAGSGAPGSVGPPPLHAFNIDINRGKRSIMLDLKTSDGLEVFWRLVEDADVVVQNFRDGVADALGIGYDAVRARRPDIVYASLNMYGYEGPWRGRPGHEQLAQAGTGMAVRYGGDGPPLLQHVGAVNDYGTGLMGAYAVSLALLHRRRTGEGQHVSTSLAHTAGVLQSLHMHDFAGKVWDEPRGQGALGMAPLQRLYAASDGWFFLGATTAQLPALARVDGLDGIDALEGETLEQSLVERFATAPVELWVKRLVEAGAGAHRVVRLPEVMDDPWVRAHELVITRDHGSFGAVDQTGVTVRLSRTPAAAGRAAPTAGIDAPEILAEHGLGAEIDRLVASGGVRLPE